MTERHHRFDFIEIATRDIAASKEFFGRVFGWTFQDWGGEYADIQGAGISGGLRQIAEKDAIPRGGVLAILYSADLPGTEREVTARGGAILEHHEFPGGRRFHFREPGGAELAVWTHTEHV